ncbi:hypothetical protein [Azospirillum argentinense]
MHKRAQVDPPGDWPSDCKITRSFYHVAFAKKVIVRATLSGDALSKKRIPLSQCAVADKAPRQKRCLTEGVTKTREP